MQDFLLSLLQSTKTSGGSSSPLVYTDAIYLTLRGQSNALGRADVVDLPTADQETQEDIYIYYESSNVGLYKAGDFKFNTGEYGVELFLAQKLRDYHGVPVIIDKRAQGGTNLAVDWLGSGDLWATSQEWKTYNDKYQKIQLLNGIHKLFVWFQGETDGFTESYANAYQVNQQYIFDAWRTEIGDSESKIVDILTASNQGDYASTVRAAKLAISALDSNIVNLDSDDYAKGDGTHLYEAGFRALAEDIFQEVKDYWDFT